MFSLIKTPYCNTNPPVTIYALLSKFWISRFTRFFAPPRPGPPRGFTSSPRPALPRWKKLRPAHPWHFVYVFFMRVFLNALYTTCKYSQQNSTCKTPCTQTSYEVRPSPKGSYPVLEIGLEFDREVDVTRIQFSFSIWDVLTGLGGAVSRTFHGLD